MQSTITVKNVAVEGYPDKGQRAVFLFDGCWVSGWPSSVGYETDDEGLMLWEANEDVGLSGRRFSGVRFWFDANEIGGV